MGLVFGLKVRVSVYVMILYSDFDYNTTLKFNYDADFDLGRV